MAYVDLTTVDSQNSSWSGPLARLEALLSGLEVAACADLEVELITETLTVEEAVDFSRTLAELGMLEAAESVIDAVATTCRAANGWFHAEMSAAVA